MGEVWIARRSALGGAAKLVAIKTVLPEKARNPESRRMFLDEARLSMLMSNSNIVQVFDADETADGTCYMAMEYVDGIDLAKLTDSCWARGEQLSHSAIAYIIGEVLKALAYAHDLNLEGVRHTIIHRDISPHNVMVSASGEVKLMDFGIARLSSEETSGTFIKGKVRYMPPEQLKRSVRAPTLDLFAVGAILHELLDGKRFRAGDYDDSEMLGMCFEGFIPPLTCPPERVTAVFEKLRKGLLEPVVAHRIPSAREAHRLLSRWPGDRDAKFELEEIVQRVTGTSSIIAPSASGAGATEFALSLEPQMPPTDLLPPTAHELDTDAKRERPSEVPADEASTDSRNRDMLTTQVLAREPAPETSSKPNRLKWLAATLASAGMGLAVTSLGTVLGWWSDDAGVQSVAEGPEIMPAEPEPVKSEPVKSELAKSEPVKSELAKPEPTEPVSDDAPPPKPTEPKPKPSKQVPKTTVIITAAGVWAQVKVAGNKPYTFDRLKGIKQITVKLEAGYYAVSFRDDPDAVWRSLGKIRIPKDGPVTVDIKAGKAIVGN